MLVIDHGLQHRDLIAPRAQLACRRPPQLLASTPGLLASTHDHEPFLSGGEPAVSHTARIRAGLTLVRYAAEVRGLVSAIRANEWWEHKLAPILGSGYATGYLLGVPLTHLLPAFLLAIIALAPGAAYVSLLNDLTDAAADRAASKLVGFAGRRLRTAVSMLAVCGGAGLAIALLAWRHDALVASLYAGAWIAFASYSLAPLRLKNRGFAGTVADALGSGVLPQLLIVVLVFHHAGRALDPWWMGLVGSWVLAHGMRLILRHQLADADADMTSGLRTFARAHPDASRRLGAYLLYPIEVLAFVALLLDAQCWLAVGLGALYGGLWPLRARFRSERTWVIAPGQGRLAMHECYVVLYPIAFLVSSTARHPGDVVVLILQLVLFPRMLAVLLLDITRVVDGLIHGASARLRRVASGTSRRVFG